LWFDTPNDTAYVGLIDLKGSTLELVDSRSNRPWTFHVISKQKQHLVIAAASSEEMNEWLTALKINGATDGEYSRKELETRQKDEEKRKVDERKKQEKEQVKAEDEYIKNRDQIMAERLARQQREQSSTDPVNCYCEFRVTEGKEQDGKMLYKIQVLFSGQEWKVFRFEKQFSDLYSNLVSQCLGIRGQLPRKKDSIEIFCAGLTTFLTILSRERQLIFMDKKSTAFYTRFIAPCQVGDEKGADFAMPFKIDIL